MPKNTEQTGKSGLPDAVTLFTPSLQALRLNLGTFLAQLLPVMGLWLLVGLSASFTLLLIALPVSVFAFATVIITQLESARQRRIGLGAVIRKTLPHFWRLVGLLILSSIVTVVGFLLLIVPGLFALQRLLFAPYFLVEERLGVLAAMKKSYATSKDKSNAGAIWGVTWMIIAINALGLINNVILVLVSTVLWVLYMSAPAILYVLIGKQRSTAVKA